MTTKLRSVDDVLGDVLNAVQVGDIDGAFDTLTTDRAHIAAVLIEELEGKREKTTEHDGDIEWCRKRTKNQALDTAIALIRTTLDVTSE